MKFLENKSARRRPNLFLNGRHVKLSNLHFLLCGLQMKAAVEG